MQSCPHQYFVAIVVLLVTQTPSLRGTQGGVSGGLAASSSPPPSPPVTPQSTSSNAAEKSRPKKGGWDGIGAATASIGEAVSVRKLEKRESGGSARSLDEILASRATVRTTHAPDPPRYAPGPRLPRRGQRRSRVAFYLALYYLLVAFVVT